MAYLRGYPEGDFVGEFASEMWYNEIQYYDWKTGTQTKGFFTTLRNFICIKFFAENNRFYIKATKNKRLDILLNLSGMIL